MRAERTDETKARYNYIEKEEKEAFLGIFRLGYKSHLGKREAVTKAHSVWLFRPVLKQKRNAKFLENINVPFSSNKENNEP